MRIIVINGPNINMLGVREPEIYGKKTYENLCEFIKNEADKLNIEVEFFQSNHEGAIVDKIQQTYYENCEGIVINPAAYTHTSVAILDALKTVGLPTVEVHISDINSREDFRKLSYVGMYAEKTFAGYDFNGYVMAIKYLKSKYS